MILRAAIMTALLALLSGGTLYAGEAATYSPQRILVTVAQTSVSQLRHGGNPVARYARRSQYQRQSSVDRVLDELVEEYPLVRSQGWLMRSLGIYCEVFEVESVQALQPLLSKLRADPRVDSAQPMQSFTTNATERSSRADHKKAPANAPKYNDTYYALQHSLRRLEVESSHRIATGAGVRIAIIDSGVETEHPDLSDDIGIEDFTDQAQEPVGYHGTGLAGVIVARPNNSLGIVGIAPDARILSLRACWGDTSAGTAAQCNSFTLARALDRAIAADTDVINLSLVGPQDPLLGRLLEKAHSQGIFLVAASRSGANNFPASLPFVLGVDAESFESGSVVAPGEDVMTTLPSATFGYMSGSSLAAAHVSAVAALLVQINPALAGPELLNLFKAEPQVNACRLAAQVAPQSKQAKSHARLTCG